MGRFSVLNIDEKDTLALQLKSLFPKFLEERLGEQGDGERIEAYISRYYGVDFDLVVRSRCEGLVTQMSTVVWDIQQMQRWAEGIFEDLFCEFIIVYCGDLSRVALSPAILGYAGVERGNEAVHLGQMVADYLDTHIEGMEIYANLTQVPATVLRNAFRSYLQPSIDERVLAVCNQTIWIRKGWEGFGLTTSRIYWRSPFSKPERVFYRDIVDLKLNKCLYINGIYFNVREDVNFKVMYLLKKMKNMI